MHCGRSFGVAAAAVVVVVVVEAEEGGLSDCVGVVAAAVAAAVHGALDVSHDSAHVRFRSSSSPRQHKLQTQ